MHRSLAITSAAVFLLVAPSSTRAADLHAPRLELPASWFSIVEPYRYDEARRYERGWNRGADVDVRDGNVRAPASGRVRFAGSVAGRSVVTIDTRVDGLPVVVTLTGLDRWDVAEGDVVRRGAIIGSGRGVHIGMYDQARRSRYLPVVGPGGGGAAAGVPGDGAAVRADGAAERSPLAYAVASRLLDAIRGDGLGAMRGGSVATNGGSGAKAPLAVPIARFGPAPRLTEVLRDSTYVRNDRGRATGVAPILTEVLRDPTNVRNDRGGAAEVAPLVTEVLRDPTDVRSHDVWSGAEADAVMAPGREVPSHDSTAVAGTHGVRGMGGDPATASGGEPRPHGTAIGRATPQPHADAVVIGAAVHETDIDDVAGAGDTRPVAIEDATVSDATITERWSVAAGLAALLATLLLAIRRCRRHRRRGMPGPVARRIARPLPPILPTMHARPAAPVRTDGHSIIGGAPLAWADHEAGTSTHEPELLRHHADLLPERAAPPGPRVHDDRGGRDHPLPATHGP